MSRRCIIAIGLSVVALTSCYPSQGGSKVKSLGSDVFVALGDTSKPTEKTIMVSFPTKMDADICVVQRGESCASPSKKIPLEKPLESQGRFIYQAKLTGNLSTFSDYMVINRASGTSALKFRLKHPTLGLSTDTSLSLFSKDIMNEELMFITQDKFSGRLAGTKENELIADFLIGELRRYDIKPAFGDYRQNFQVTVGPTQGKTSSNIIGIIEGSDPTLKNEYVVIGAHMDHAGTTSKGYTCSSGPGNDGICNGADDNGSGAVALLSIARSLSASRQSLKRSVLVMWFSGEEEGLLGSRHYVANPAVPLGKHVFMINLDMIGYAKTFGNSIAAIGTTTSKWGDATAKTLGQKYPSHKLKFTNKVEGGSDHASFMNKGIPGIFYHTGVSNNPNYHKTSDHVDLIDFDGLLVAAKLAFETVVAASSTNELAARSGLSLADTDKFVSDADASKGCHYLMDYKYLD